ncbi:carboxy-S-adenosyl-L-methionine synthase CmoA [Sulfidibacter corallicola]|uniref:Carboxy-S-adenosyl-L-methionine synthase n=1 Tax=Sulfidibacter corallicola TaxID=2818388 RepID=A0A8A4THB7_SULCO|nr:carboxy-S-adenosyl-L-methionine synthase CmoA [Sulfidibacter corallicola]QTD48138.1 carboxy-S-adenosyl-L-methionine synthase CmoA [Sulfidibacter corallicola]
MKDELFKEPLSRATDFTFNRDVAAVFDDMVHRSIPFYGEVQNMIVDLVAHYYQDETLVYDLGCSTGVLIAKLAAALPGLKGIVGLDNSEPMIEKTRERLAGLPSKVPIDLVCEDLRDFEPKRASAVIMNYTLQFVRPLYREHVMRHIFEGLVPGGILILSEKVLEDSTDISRLFVDMYYQFKRRQGYSDMEISQKREQLENVLVPYKVSEQRELLQRCGFREVEIFFKWNNFASFVAIRSL